MVVGDHVECLLQGTVGDEARPLLYANHMPRAVQVICQSTLVRSPRWTGVPRHNLQFVGRALVGPVGLQGRAGGTRSKNPAMGSHLLNK